MVDDLSTESASWPSVVQRSLLSESMKERYSALFEERSLRLFNA